MNAVVHGRIGVRLNNFQDFLQVVGFLFVGLKLWGDVIGCCGMCRYYRCRSMHKSWFSFGFVVGIMSRGVTGVFPAHCVCVVTRPTFLLMRLSFWESVWVCLPKSPALRYSPGHPSPFWGEGQALCNTEAFASQNEIGVEYSMVFSLRDACSTVSTVSQYFNLNVGFYI